MPHSSPTFLRAQHQRLFTSSARDSAVEHLSHMDRLGATRLSPRTGIRDRPEVDFRSPEAENERITLAMATKLRKEYEAEEQRIRLENDFLMRRLEVHASVDDRRKHHVHLVPIEQEKPFAEQGSNIGAKRKEAQRITADNETLMFAMATMKPTVQMAKIKKSVEKHDALVKRISKFRPASNYAGEELMCRSPRSPARQTSPRSEWQHISPHDVVRHRKETDRAVRSVFLRNEDEVLQEAANTPKLSDVRARRQTWTQLGHMAARIPKPPEKS